jgi:hypothetical protein
LDFCSAELTPVLIEGYAGAITAAVAFRAAAQQEERGKGRMVDFNNFCPSRYVEI